MAMNRITVVRGTFIVVFLTGFILMWVGCGATPELEQLSAEQRFHRAMTLFSDKSYLDAYEEFRIVTLQFQGSPIADSAQFMMGDSRFLREEYLLAAYEYDVLIRTMPTNRLVPLARYKRAMSYYRQSPEYYHDQTSTRQAIEEFQSFIEYHPTDSLVTDAEAKISELNAKLARKEFENGITYMHMEYYRSAATTFDHVLEKYHDSPFAEQAQLKKAEAMLMRNKLPEARSEIEKFLTKYPASKFKQDAEALQKDILNRLVKAPGTPARPPVPAGRADISNKE
jgi:outer membrane protein assembly factor BamD